MLNGESLEEKLIPLELIELLKRLAHTSWTRRGMS